MITLDDLADVLTPATLDAWPHVAAVTPPDGALMGGTALAVHLHHRTSRDLDVFVINQFNPDDIERELRARGSSAPVQKGEGTRNGVFGGAKVQFFWARGQKTLEAARPIWDLPVGSLSDIFATKLKVVADRGELRDYFDLMAIEERTGRRVEEGLLLYMRRYGVEATHPTVDAIVRGLGFFDDVNDDPYLVDECGSGIRSEVEAYWQQRQVEVVAHLDPRSPLPINLPIVDPRIAAAIRARKPDS